jgi:hypothetical protein
LTDRAEAVSFWLLAPHIAVEAIRDLAAHHPASTTVLGISVTAASVIIMPVLGVAKHRLGGRLGSGATAEEGTQNREPLHPLIERVGDLLIGLGRRALVDHRARTLSWPIRAFRSVWATPACPASVSGVPQIVKVQPRHPNRSHRVRPADGGVEAAPYPRRVIPVTTHARPRALQYKATMTRTRACCSAALWVSARSATARPSCTE